MPNVPATPLNFTEVTPKKPVPLTVMLCPAKPELGLKLVTLGCNPNVWVLRTLPPTA